MKKNRKRIASVVMTLALLVQAPVLESVAAESTAKEGQSETKLLQEAGEILSSYKLGEEEQEYLDELKERLASGELDTEEEILDAIEEAEEKFNFTLPEDQQEKIVSLTLKVQDLGLDSEELAEIAEKLIEKYGNRIKESADEAIQENIVEPAREAVTEGTKSAVRNFFGEMKKSLVGFWEKLTK